MNLKKLTLKASALIFCLSSAAQAQTVSITVENLTHGIHFTPILAAFHGTGYQMFEAGTTASASLTAMAEGGSLDGLTTDVTNAGGSMIANPANGLLAPGDKVTTAATTIDETQLNRLSVVAMMLPTNDGFIGLNSWPIPTTAGTYTINVNAYDAGTEANNELILDDSGAPGVLGIPAAPGGNVGTGGQGVTSSDTNTHVHIHRGALGDTNLTGGISDLDSTVHRWLNPVARITVEVQ